MKWGRGMGTCLLGHYAYVEHISDLYVEALFLTFSFFVNMFSFRCFARQSVDASLYNVYLDQVCFVRHLLLRLGI